MKADSLLPTWDWDEVQGLYIINSKIIVHLKNGNLTETQIIDSADGEILVFVELGLKAACEELFVILLYHISFVFSYNFCVQFSKLFTVLNTKYNFFHLIHFQWQSSMMQKLQTNFRCWKTLSKTGFRPEVWR